MSCPHCKRRRPQSGAALIVALLVFALASALMVGLQRDFMLQMQRGSNVLATEQGWAYLKGAEALASITLRLDAEQDALRDKPQDDLTELWASPPTPYPLEEGGFLMGQLEDLQGRFNINTLVESATNEETGSDGAPPGAADEQQGAGGAPRLTPAQKQFIRLLMALEGPEIDRNLAATITDSVIDFIDVDSEPRLSGAENSVYQSLVPPYRTSGQPFASVSELRAVQGITPEIYRALAPAVSVWPRSGAKLNFLTAPLVVLRSLNTDDRLEPLPMSEALRLYDLRDAGEIPDVETLLQDVAFTGGSSEQLKTLLDNNSQWFLLTASVEVGDRQMGLLSVLERSNSEIRTRFRSRSGL